MQIKKHRKPPKGWKRDLDELIWEFESDRYAPKDEFYKIIGQMAVEEIHNCGETKDKRGYKVGWWIEEKDGKKFEDVNRGERKEPELVCISSKELAKKTAREKQEELSEKYFRRRRIEKFGVF